jgi:Family of unknown function (DUF5372)
MGTAPIIVGDPLARDSSEVAFVERDQPIETLPADRPDQALAKRWRELSIAPPSSGEAQTFRVTHPFHPLRGRTFPLVACRQTWGEDRVYFHDDAGQLARLPWQWTDVAPNDPTVVVA